MQAYPIMSAKKRLLHYISDTSLSFSLGVIIILILPLFNNPG